MRRSIASSCPILLASTGGEAVIRGRPGHLSRDLEGATHSVSRDVPRDGPDPIFSETRRALDNAAEAHGVVVLKRGDGLLVPRQATIIGVNCRWFPALDLNLRLT